jgi:hypothetical protein
MANPRFDDGKKALLPESVEISILKAKRLFFTREVTWVYCSGVRYTNRVVIEKSKSSKVLTDHKTPIDRQKSCIQRFA